MHESMQDGRVLCTADAAKAKIITSFYAFGLYKSGVLSSIRQATQSNSAWRHGAFNPSSVSVLWFWCSTSAVRDARCCTETHKACASRQGHLVDMLDMMRVPFWFHSGFLEGRRLLFFVSGTGVVCGGDEMAHKPGIFLCLELFNGYNYCTELGRSSS